MTTYEKNIYYFLGDNPIVREMVKEYYGKSLEFIYQKVNEKEHDSTSFQLFDGSIILMYPKINMKVSKKRISCDFSDALINAGDIYVSYQALLIELNNSFKYVISPEIKVEPYYEKYLPMNIAELDELELNILDGEYKDGIHYDILKKKYGGIPLKRVKVK